MDRDPFDLVMPAFLGTITLMAKARNLSETQEGRVLEFFSKARSLSESGRYMDALIILDRIEPMTVGYGEHREILLTISHCREMIGDTTGALKVLDGLMEQYPSGARVYRRKKASVLERAGDLDGCIHVLRDMLKDDRRDLETLLELTRVLCRLGARDEARDMLDMAYGDLGRWDVSGTVMIAKAFRLQIGDRARAREVLDRMSGRLCKKGHEYHIERAKAYADVDQDLASGIARKVLTRRPHDRDALEIMASVSRARGDEAGARDYEKRMDRSRSGSD